VDYLPEDYDSDNLPVKESSSKPRSSQEVLSSDTQALLAKLNGVGKPADELEVPLKETKIIFCSRTHSQLSQFVKELRRVKPPPSIVSLDEDEVDISESPQEEIIKHLSLGSRKNLCINPKVSKLNSVTAISERCFDLQKPGVSAEQKCGFLPSKENKDLVDSFRDHALAEIHDIEDLGSLGRSIGVCPYYASRSGIDQSEILTLPYPLLLQKSAREALGVSVKDHVVIIDEAHNLMDAIADIYSCSMSLQQLESATSQVMAYVLKFKNRLKGKNRMYVTQIIRLMRSIEECLVSVSSTTRENEAIMTPAQLLAGKGVDQIQPYKLIRYLQESKLAHKVENYILSTHENPKSELSTSGNRGTLQNFQSFLAVLMNPSDEGRFFFSRDDENQVQIRYTLLDPREHFRDVVEEARAVILAGGTMSPMSDYKDYLFSYLAPERLETFSFGHVVPKENIFAQPISMGPSGMEFDFTFEKRKSEKMIVGLGMMFINACKNIPDGVVAFFPSYDYLDRVVSVWKKTQLHSGTPSAVAPTRTIFSTLNSIKPIFHETKQTPPQPPSQTHQPPSNHSSDYMSSSHPIQTPSLLQSYTASIDRSSSSTHRGALLLSVISGTLSEGINFSDALGRAVFAIGIPYPNPHSAVWKAKMRHIEEQYIKAHSEHSSAVGNGKTTNMVAASVAAPPPSVVRMEAKKASREFYENSAMRAVNQAVGRAIRHRGDYAAIMLVDRRYDPAEGGARVWRKLPAWIREWAEDGNRQKEVGGERKSWSDVEEGLRGFFDGKV
jgi:chromosome transmission fidelity protein 1